MYFVASDPSRQLISSIKFGYTMRLDRILQYLLPKDDKFYLLLEESISYIDQAADEILKISSASSEERANLVIRIQDLEHKGDDVTHKIFSELDSTFVTPFDREDIHLLASELDDILDYIDGSIRRITLYKIDHFPVELINLIEKLNMSVKELKRGIPQLRKLENSEVLREVIRKVNDYENDADTIFASGIAELFDKETNPIEIIKLKEVFVALETATDKCEDVANVLETILIKHS